MGDRGGRAHLETGQQDRRSFETLREDTVTVQVQVLLCRSWRTETCPAGLGSPETRRFTTPESRHYVNPPPHRLTVGLACLLSLSLDGI